MEVVGGKGVQDERSTSRLDDILSSVASLLQYPTSMGCDLSRLKPMIDPRSVYRRLPRYSTQMEIHGIAARDISSYFVKVSPDALCIIFVFMHLAEMAFLSLHIEGGQRCNLGRCNR